MTTIIKAIVIGASPALVIASHLRTDHPVRVLDEPASQPSTQPSTQPEPLPAAQPPMDISGMRG